MSEKNVSESRKFLHDISTPVSVLKLTLHRVLKSLNGDGPVLTQEQMAGRLKVASDEIDKLENRMANEKERISKLPDVE